MQGLFACTLLGWSVPLRDVSVTARVVEAYNSCVPCEKINTSENIIPLPGVLHNPEIGKLGPKSCMLDVGTEKTLSEVLLTAGIDANTIQKIESSVSRKKFFYVHKGQKIQLALQGNKLLSVKIYRDMARSWLLQTNTKGGWGYHAVKNNVIARYERLRLPVTDTLKKALISAKIDRRLTLDIAKSLGKSGIIWGYLRGATVDVMYQKLENPETKASALSHIAMIRIDQKKSSRTYYAHQINSKASRRAFYTLAGFSVGGMHAHGSASASAWVKPVEKSRVTSGFGHRKHPIYGCFKHHNGIDFSGKKGTPIKAIGSGVVASVQRNGSYGNYIKISHGHGYQTLYAHLSSTLVRVGQKVRAGQTIGGMGSTGRTTGTHLHLEVSKNGRVIDPMKVIGSAQKTTSLYVDKGFTTEQKRKFYAQAKMLNKTYRAMSGSFSQQNRKSLVKKIDTPIKKSFAFSGLKSFSNKNRVARKKLRHSVKA